MTTKLQRLCTEQGQSPWLDNLRRGWITGGELGGSARGDARTARTSAVPTWS